MEGILDSGDHLERELTAEPIAGPAVGAVGLHLAVFSASGITFIPAWWR